MKLFQSSQDRDLELLSAYLDDELSAGERAKLERRLATDSNLRRTLAGFRQVQTTLADLPRVKPPRSFVLKPHMVGQARRAPSPLIPILNYATTIAAILFAVFIGSELATGFRPLAAPLAVQNQTVGQAESAPAMEAPVAAQEDQATLKQATSTPASETLPFAAQSTCENGQEPLTGGGCASGGDGAAGNSEPAAGGAGGGGSESAPPETFSVAAAVTEGTPDIDSVAADALALTPTPDDTLVRTSATEASPTLEAPAPVLAETDFYQTASEAQVLSPTRWALYILGGVLVLLLIASIIVRRR